MLAFRQGMATPPRKVRFVHGDPYAKQTLQAEVETWAREAGHDIRVTQATQAL